MTGSFTTLENLKENVESQKRLHQNNFKNEDISNIYMQDALNLMKNITILPDLTRPSLNSQYCTKKVFLTIIVLSAPGNFLQRNAIRGAWGNSNLKLSDDTESKLPSTIAKDRIKVVFIIGKTRDKTVQDYVTSESRLFRDIVFGNFIDKYDYLTLKTILGLKWTRHFCKGSYVMKADDDVFINLRMLVDWLQKQQRKMLYTGRCTFDGAVIRNHNSKW